MRYWGKGVEGKIELQRAVTRKAKRIAKAADGASGCPTHAPFWGFSALKLGSPLAVIA